jgi:hypothetical protein
MEHVVEAINESIQRIISAEDAADADIQVEEVNQFISAYAWELFEEEGDALKLLISMITGNSSSNVETRHGVSSDGRTQYPLGDTKLQINRKKWKRFEDGSDVVDAVVNEYTARRDRAEASTDRKRKAAEGPAAADTFVNRRMGFGRENIRHSSTTR